MNQRFIILDEYVMHYMSYVYVYVCIYICIYLYIYKCIVHIHTSTHVSNLLKSSRLLIADHFRDGVIVLFMCVR